MRFRRRRRSAVICFEDLRWRRRKERGKAEDVPSELAADPAEAIRLCQASHTRLLATVQRVTDAQVRAPTRLPGWTIAHVLNHVARHADGHARRLAGALHGEDVPRYPGGSRQRDGDIEKGVQRSVEELLADLDSSQH